MGSTKVSFDADSHWVQYDPARSLLTTSGGMLHLPSLPDCVAASWASQRLHARFPAILSTPQEIGCLCTLGLDSTSCRNLNCKFFTFFGSPFSASGSYSGLVRIVVGRAVVSCLLWL